MHVLVSNRRLMNMICLYCSVDDDLNVKVTDCALSRDLFPQDYCCLGDNENRPVKWMAVESLEHGRYTVASDVVSKETGWGGVGVVLIKSPQSSIPHYSKVSAIVNTITVHVESVLDSKMRTEVLSPKYYRSVLDTNTIFCILGSAFSS